MRIAFFISLSFLFLISCGKSEQNVANDETAEVTVQPKGEVGTPLNIHKGGNYASLEQIRVQALNIINHRVKTEPEPLAMLTYAYWTPEFVYNGKSISNSGEYVGYWIKFDDDFTYKYGQDSKLLGKGRYHFRLDDKNLHMLDNDVESEPKVWMVNHAADVLALVGTHEYQVNNGMQIKMVALEKNPI